MSWNDNGYFSCAAAGGCLKTFDFAGTGASEYKFYLPGVGMVRVKAFEDGLSILKGLSYKEISVQQDVSEKTVRQQVLCDLPQGTPERTGRLVGLFSKTC